MASRIDAKDYAHEKQDTHHVEDLQVQSTESSNELQKERTLEGIDMINSRAVKGDDSDGKVVWNVRSMFAAVFLASLYTGSQVSS
jgi:hypothetical protein